MTEKITFDNSSWDESVWNGKSAEEYCAACLIDENEGEKVKERCKLPYKKPDSSAVNKNALRTMATGRGLPAVDASSEAKKKAANWMISMWPRAFDTKAPDSIYKIAGKDVPTKSKVAVYKDFTGNMIFVGIYSNNFMDREDETITWEAHQKYAAEIRDLGIQPPIILMHQPSVPPVFHLAHLMALKSGKISVEKYNENLLDLYRSTAIAKTTSVIPMEGFTMVIGEVLPGKESIAEKIMGKKNRWGMSHGFLNLRKRDNIIEAYHSFEFSVVPASLAANELTRVNFKLEKTDG